MRPLAARALKLVGVAWCVVVVVGYFAISLFSEHGGGIFSQEGWGEMSLIVLACLPGWGLIKLASRMNDAKSA